MPTCAKGTTLACSASGAAFASIPNTSSSGSERGTNALQSRPSSSRHVPVAASKRTICETGGASSPARLRSGSSVAPAAFTTVAGIAVVWLPEAKLAAYTRLPSGLAARARGASPNSVSTAIGSPPDEPGDVVFEQRAHDARHARRRDDRDVVGELGELVDDPDLAGQPRGSRRSASRPAMRDPRRRGLASSGGRVRKPLTGRGALG